MCEEFLSENVNEEKHINEEIFRNYFKYQNPSSLVKDLFKVEKNKRDKIRYLIINEFIKLMEDINLKEIPENKNPKKVVNIVEKVLNFNKQQKGKGIKILTPKQMLQRLPIALTQVIAGNTSENLLNEIRQIIHSLYREKEIKKVYNNLINSIKL